ncbi:expressed protein [Phakopsora pachyrhizi]|uniref:Expressed protein n=1 Tax=Phakopsora pachyrhizi TaxID=170000 RepID=A0AAV0B1X5_PHAPC|nr:expressed protein [Phakopsora pachyrhizi]
MENQKSVFSTSINPTGEEVLSNIGADKSYKEMSNLLKVLAEQFRTCSKEMARKQAAYRTQGLRESKNYQKENLNNKYIDEQILTISYLAKQAEIHIAYSLASAIFRHKIFTSTENVYRIQWINDDALKEEIRLFSENFVFEKAEESNKCTQEHMEKISIMGITFMKIISKKYPENLVSEEFGNDKSLIEYTKLFWTYCFSSHVGNEEALTGFFMSIRKGTSNDYIKEILLTDFIREEINQDQIISFIRKKITSKTYRDQVYMFAWHFCYIRTVVYYPELLINIRKNNRDLLRNFIESGILYHLRLQDYDVNR